MAQGKLYVVATPLGNLGDITYRAVEILKQVALIAAEDTRHSKTLLHHYAIHTPLISLHQHNEKVRCELLLKQLVEGKDIALISDAGTPLISDPGYHLVHLAHQQGIQTIPIPGACAAVSALCVSGFDASKFVFEGFLPAKQSERIKRLTELKEETRTLVFYETPHRILSMLQDLITTFGGDRQVILARELTKRFETVVGKPAELLLLWMTDNPIQQKGEYVLVIEGAKLIKTPLNEEELTRILSILCQELPLKQAVNLAVKITNQKKNQLYDLALKLTSDI